MSTLRAIIFFPFYKPVVLAAGLAASSVSWVFNTIFQSLDFSHPLVSCVLGIVSAVIVVRINEYYKSRSNRITQLNLSSDRVSELVTRERGRYEGLIQEIYEKEVRDLQAENQILRTRLSKYEQPPV